MKSFDSLCDRWNFPRSETSYNVIIAIDSLLTFDGRSFAEPVNVLRSALWNADSIRSSRSIRSTISECFDLLIESSFKLNDLRNAIRFGIESKGKTHGRIDFASKISRADFVPSFTPFWALKNALVSSGVSIRPLKDSENEKIRAANKDRFERNEVSAHPWKRSVGNPMELPQGSIDNDPKSHRPHSKTRRFEIASNLEKKPQSFDGIENPFVSVRRASKVRVEKTSAEILDSMIRENRIR
jgi:hypothetical protein